MFVSPVSWKTSLLVGVAMLYLPSGLVSARTFIPEANQPSPPVPMLRLAESTGLPGSAGAQLVTGDLNCDGFDDLVIAAPTAVGTDGQENSGKVYLLYGRADLLAPLSGDAATYTSELLENQADAVWTGAGGELFGYTLAIPGDINGDGFPDLAVGAPAAFGLPPREGLSRAGRMYLFYGGGSSNSLCAGGGEPPSQPLGEHPATEANAMVGGTIAGAELGWGLSGLMLPATAPAETNVGQDLDGDGCAELLVAVAAQDSSPGAGDAAGRVLLLSGTALPRGGCSWDQPETLLTVVGESGGLGSQMAAKVQADHLDLLLSALGTNSSRGSVYWLTIPLTTIQQDQTPLTLPGSAKAILRGSSKYERLGASLGWLPAQGDAPSQAMVGAPDFYTDSAFIGRTVAWTLDPSRPAGTEVLATELPMLLTSAAGAGELGSALAITTALDPQGTPWLFMADAGICQSGSEGGTTGQIFLLSSSNLPGTQETGGEWMWQPMDIWRDATPGECFGSALALGDLDGDGLQDLVAGARGDGLNLLGGVYIFGAVGGFYDLDGDGYVAYSGFSDAEPLVHEDVAITPNPGNDCDEKSASIHPGVTEVCDAVDNDCNGQVDDMPELLPYWPDNDVDQFGDLKATPEYACNGAPSGKVDNGLDCEDRDASIFPGAAEQCNNNDDDCNQEIDDGIQQLWYPDFDNDSYGDDYAKPMKACAQPDHYVLIRGDCDDSISLVNPDAAELLDDLDNDCRDGAATGTQFNSWGCNVVPRGNVPTADLSASPSGPGLSYILGMLLACRAHSKRLRSRRQEKPVSSTTYDS